MRVVLASFILPFLLAMGPPSGSETNQRSLAFTMSVCRMQGGDSVSVVATVTNTGTSDFRAWGMLECLGGYRLSVETYHRYQALRDSIASAEKGNAIHRHEFRPPMFALIPRFEPLLDIRLRPGESYSDTLGLRLHPSDFEQFPGYIDLECDFLVGAGPAGAPEALRLGREDMRVAIPVP